MRNKALTREAYRERAKQRNAEGLCRDCPNRLDGDHVRCKACRRKQSLRQSAREAARKKPARTLRGVSVEIVHAPRARKPIGGSLYVWMESALKGDAA